MSTLRYSGDIRIRVTYHDRRFEDVYEDGTPRNPNGFYRCFLRASNNTTTIIVGAPAFLSQAVDSPEAFSDAARAAVAFADHEDPEAGWYDRCCSDDKGVFVTTTRDNDVR
jgi:hypothetical protein